MNGHVRSISATLLLAAAAGRVAAQSTDSLRIYYVARPVGWERYTIDTGGGRVTMNADFSYVDRGRR